METKEHLKKLRGWFPKEPIQNSYHSINQTPMSKAKFNKKTSKAAWIANSIMTSVFLGTNFLLIHPLYESLEVTALQWGIFVPAVVLVNVLIYWHFKKQTTSD